MLKEICPGCPWSQEPETELVFDLLRYAALQEAGCPIERHELSDDMWLLLGVVKTELAQIAREDAEEKARRARDGR